ncbi:MAG TPA: biopolymer transporter ExbD [Verrucomicrobiae bacterium]|nr:biopolymer transporter ExbD [Verrucomicrobiae bacterium]
MRRYSQRTAVRSLAELNVTPMIDLAFTLLIVFAIATPAIEQSIQVTTPESSVASKAPTPDKIAIVSIDAAGRVYLDGKGVDLAALETGLAGRVARDKELSVGIRADRSLSYQAVVDVIDVLRRAGVTRFGLVTRAPD